MPTTVETAGIQIDDRAGSDRLGKALRARRQPGVSIHMTRLEFGDAAFTGIGADERPVQVGIEYKTVPDTLQCITDGRFAGHQLPGMLQSYEVCVLLVEGATRPSAKDGILQVQHSKGYWYDAHLGARKFMHRALDKWLMTLTFKAGIHVVRTLNLEESAAYVANCYQWWNEGFDSHKSCFAIHSPDNGSSKVTIFKPNLVSRMAACLPGIGADRAAIVGRKFRSPIEMVLAEEREWSSLDGIGKLTADKVCAAMRGESGKR